MVRKRLIKNEPPIARKKINEALMLDYLCSNLQVDNQTGVPLIFRYDVSDPIPTQMIAFHEAISAKNQDFDKIVHFYEDDYRFLRLFRNPENYLSKLRQYKYVLSPDMSQLVEMPAFARYACNCHNKAMAQYLQRNGVNVIANVTWSLPDSYE